MPDSKWCKLGAKHFAKVWPLGPHNGRSEFRPQHLEYGILERKSAAGSPFTNRQKGFKAHHEPNFFQSGTTYTSKRTATTFQSPLESYQLRLSLTPLATVSMCGRMVAARMQHPEAHCGGPQRLFLAIALCTVSRGHRQSRGAQTSANVRVVGIPTLAIRRVWVPHKPADCARRRTGPIRRLPDAHVRHRCAARQGAGRRG